MMSKHDVLWAPWRLAFIQQEDQEDQPPSESGCFICQAVTDSQDRKRHVFFRSETSIGILNRYPYNNGHLLIAPKRHAARLGDLAEAETLDLMRQITRWVERLEQEMQPDGFNIGLNLGHAAGAGLPGHLHWHIVPRWTGDVNFMPVLAGVKVIPQSLDALWEILTASK